jgi:hypothetical protein
MRLQKTSVQTVAINAQTILEINAGIIGELKNSDCYLFVNFRRDMIRRKYRGSLFSNQELAIAYALGFERILIVNQSDIFSEGMLHYIGVNTETFKDFDDCTKVVGRAISRAGWKADYTRRLRAEGLRFSDEVLGYGPLVGRFVYLRFQRRDVRAAIPDIRPPGCRNTVPGAAQCTPPPYEAHSRQLGGRGSPTRSSRIRTRSST